MARTQHLNLKQLAEIVAADTGQHAGEIEKTLRASFDALARVLAAKKSLSIPNFGTFETRERPARKTLNPRTGQIIDLPIRRAVRYRTTGQLITMVRNGDTTGTIRKPGSKRKS